MDFAQPIAEGLWSLALDTPTLLPATQTNSYLVAEGDALVLVEPATPYEYEQIRLFSAIDAQLALGRVLTHLVLTHHHMDHVGATLAVQKRYGVPVAAHEGTAEKLRDLIAIDTLLTEGSTLLGGALEVLFTPGHAPGHVSLLHRASGSAIVGDMVASVGTIVIDPEDDGDMQRYLVELERLKHTGCDRLLPAHGAPIEDGPKHLQYYRDHRLGREAKIYAALAAFDHGCADTELVSRAYDDVPSTIWPVALRSLRAHLEKLLRESRVTHNGNVWRAVS
ncbi:MAG: MBL fold metallo-hydrolase [Deltaproteobacteria bacterium]|nr:MBL fold metallo-hydrolase [Deltaproteobacteria bacterium]